MSGAEILVVEARTHGRALLRRAVASRAGAIVGFHGYAETAAVQLERLAAIPGAEGWDLLAVQGLHRFYRGRTQETVAGWMTREDRLIAIADNVEYVDAALDLALPRSASPLVFAGFSQGVAMAFRAAVRGRRGAHGVIAVGGDVPPELLDDPAARFPSVLLIRGEADEWYTEERLRRDVDALGARGVTIEARTIPGAHEWSPLVAPAAAEFLSAALADPHA